VLFAGWVGLLVTALNLLPVGQLDGGHILYGLLRRRANWVATIVLTTAVVLAVRLNYWWWWPMLLLLMFVVGTRHPPTANDYVPLGWFRYVLGWLTLALLPLGFTPMPFGIPH
jgi:membrane-associated protease RseP (regulator of RpoE activity)